MKSGKNLTHQAWTAASGVWPCKAELVFVGAGLQMKRGGFDKSVKQSAALMLLENGSLGIKSTRTSIVLAPFPSHYQ